MTPSARLAATAELLALIEDSASPAEKDIGAFFRARRYAGSKDRRWVTDFVYQCLRRRGEIDWELQARGLGPSARMRAVLGLILFEAVTLPDLEDIYLTGPHSLDPLSEQEKSALGASLTGDAILPAHAAGNFPEWIAAKLAGQYGERAGEIMASYQERGPVTLRVNSLKTTREDVLQLFEADGIAVRPTTLSPDGLILDSRQNLSRHPLLEKGLVEIQDEAAEIASRLADARPGMLVVDYCAGGGGKSLALAAQMENTGRICALDVDSRRMRDISARSRRAGIDIIEPAVLGGEDSDREILARLHGAADRVFVDAPCSGSGTWRRQPDQKWKLTEEKLADYCALQSEILGKAVTLVAPGGRLVYATCSLLEEENQQQVKHFLQTNPEFQVVPVSQLWPLVGLPGRADTDFFAPTPADFGSDGFFTAVLQRQG